MKKIIACILVLSAIIVPTVACAGTKIAIVGDIMVFPAMINAAKSGASYDFTPAFRHVEKLLSSYDITIGNLETPVKAKIAEEKKYAQAALPASGTSTSGIGETGTDAKPKKAMPRFYSPYEIVHAMKRCGFDLLTTANNHALDYGISGVNTTIGALDSVGIKHTGTYANAEDRAKITVLESKGLRIACLSYSTGANGKQGGIPADKRKYIMGWLYEKEEVAADIRAARQVSDVVIVFAHWGDEYKLKPNAKQKQHARWLLNAGADIVIGSHPHVLQPVDIIEQSETQRGGIVAYSMSNFISTMKHPCQYGMILTLDITRTPEGKVSTDCKYIPTVTIREGKGVSVIAGRDEKANAFAKRVVGGAIPMITFVGEPNVNKT